MNTCAHAVPDLIRPIFLHQLFLVIFMLFWPLSAIEPPASKEAGALIAYPTMPLEQVSDYTIQVAGNAIPVYDAATFRCATFACTGTVPVEITYHAGPLRSARINPTALGISCTTTGDAIRFAMRPGQYLEVQINGASSQVAQGHDLLYLYADAPETDIPAATDQRVLAFASGRHRVPGGEIHIDDSSPYDRMYLAPGALVEAVVTVKRRKPFRIDGRGFLHYPFQDKRHFALRMDGCHNLRVEGIHLYGSPSHVLKLFGGQDIHICNVKSMHYIVNSDGISLHGNVTRALIEDCFIIGNDNLIVIGGSPDLSHNTIRHCTFVKSSYAGNWAFPQGNGAIGPDNRIEDCDVIRTNGEVGLVRLWYGKPTSIDNLTFDNIRIQNMAGYSANPLKTNHNRFLSLEAPDGSFHRSMTFRNIDLPAPCTSMVAAGDWTLVFDHVRVAGKIATCDADLQIERGAGVVTRYLTDDSTPVLTR